MKSTTKEDIKAFSQTCDNLVAFVFLQIRLTLHNITMGVIPSIDHLKINKVVKVGTSES